MAEGREGSDRNDKAFTGSSLERGTTLSISLLEKREGINIGKRERERVCVFL